MSQKALLSKSKVLSGLQCEKRLYLEIHHPELGDPSTGDYMIEMGHQVGEFARHQYPKGILVEPGSLDKALAQSKDLAAKSGPPLFECTFRHRNVLVRNDILHRGSKYRVLTEVKAASRVKNEYYDDCAVQAWVVEGAGYPLDRIELAHINSDFVYHEEDNYDGLLIAEDITDRVRSHQHHISGLVKQLKAMLNGTEPTIPMGAHCTAPYTCPFYTHCQSSEQGPEYPITEMPHLGNLLGELLDEDIVDIRDIPEGRLVKPKHKRIREAILTGKAVLEKEAGEQLRALSYPRFYLDFETIAFAIPIWLQTKPYQALPFQWSCHHEKRRGGKLHHHEFLDLSGKPPMSAFTESLLEALGSKGPIFVYSAYEKRILREMAERFPEYAEAIDAVIERLVDLLKIARNCYYHPELHGSWSIKKVLPIVAPELDYGKLNGVHNGTEAQAAYTECIDGSISGERKKELDEALRKYCELDTLAMVKVAKYFEQN